MLGSKALQPLVVFNKGNSMLLICVQFGRVPWDDLTRLHPTAVEQLEGLESSKSLSIHISTYLPLSCGWSSPRTATRGGGFLAAWGLGSQGQHLWNQTEDE